MIRRIRLARYALYSLASASLLTVLLVCILYIYLEGQLPDVNQLQQVQYQLPLKILTNDGKLIEEYGEKRRIPVKYSQIPQPLVQAVLATEDQRFFQHPGVDIVGLARAGVSLLKTGTKSQGGSTITMQVARNFFLSRKKTFLRKFNEILLAIKIDRDLSKEKILELYLNKIYFGNRAYGVAAAANVYYGKKLDQLTLGEMAMIAGLPQAPSAKNPIRRPKAALKRRNHVLQRMYQLELIDHNAYVEAKKEPLKAYYHPRKSEVSAPYVAEMIRQAMYLHFGDSAYQRGYRVITTLNSRLQQAANQAVQQQLLTYDQRQGFRGKIGHIDPALDTTAQTSALKHFAKLTPLEPARITEITPEGLSLVTCRGQPVSLTYQACQWALGQKSLAQKFNLGDVVYVDCQNDCRLSQLPTIEGALVAMSPDNGAILALVGGFNFYNSKFNRITQAKRQPGSSIKPFIYAAALEKGYTLASIINDAPITMDDVSLDSLWRPQNDNRQFAGPTRLRIGLIRSRNLVSIRLLNAIGIDYATAFLEKLGFDRTTLPKSLSLALGSLEISPLSLLTQAAIIANGGYKVEPFLIDRVIDAQGLQLLKTMPQTACQMKDKHCQQLSPDRHAPRVLSTGVAFLMQSVLKDVVQHGTATRAKVLNREDIGGKTGTTNDKKDAWFAGFGPDLVAVTWMGYDDPKKGLNTYASSSALPMWIDFMKVALEKKPQHHNDTPPEDIIAVKINPNTGLRSHHSQDGILEFFRAEHLPPFGTKEQDDKAPLEELF